jgi:long-chain fatty acid transport protein
VRLGHWAVGSATAIAVACVSARASASPEDLFGYGAESPAMAGTGTATSSDFEAAYTNPALLSRIRRPRLALGVLGANFDEVAVGDGLPGRIEDRSARGLDIGADLPIPFGGVLKDRVSGALAFYTPSEVIVRGRILYPETPQFPLLSDRAQCVAIRMGVGVDIGHGVRIGGGFAALAEIVGTVVVATDAAGKVGTQIDDQLIATYAPTLGASYEHALRLFGEDGTVRVGGVFRGALAARFSVTIDATKLSSIAIPVFDIAGLAQYDPLQAGLEVAWENSKWKLAIGATWKHWSDYPGPLEPTLPDLDVPKPDYSDTVVPRVGVERSFPLSRSAKLHVRGGYFFEPTPVGAHLPSSQAYDIPSQTLVTVPTRYFDADRHVFTAGLGVSLEKPLRLDVDAFAQAHVLAPRTMTLDAGEPDGSTSTANVSGSIVVTGIQIGVGF